MQAFLPGALGVRVRIRTVLIPERYRHHRPLYTSRPLAASLCRFSSTAKAVTDVETAESNHRRYNQTIRLPDGRTLGYAEAGSLTGYPLLLFHGFPGSRLEVRFLEDMACRHNIRVIATDRPGYGLSTYHPTLRITDWPDDMQFLARQLELKRFAVLGGSGGGPYALACASAIPSESLSSVGLFASAGPWEAGTQDVFLSARIGSWAATNCPSLATVVIDVLVRLAERFASTSTGKKLMDSVLDKAVETSGQKVPKDEGEDASKAVVERRERAMRIFLEPFAQGSKGFVRDAYLLTHPYGFRLEDIKQKVHVWHGTKDTNSPIRMLRYVKDKLPDCEMREYEGETHFTIVRHLEEIVTTLVPANVSKPHGSEGEAGS